jgi:hypothetical protein
MFARKKRKCLGGRERKRKIKIMKEGGKFDKYKKRKREKESEICSLRMGKFNKEELFVLWHSPPSHTHSAREREREHIFMPLFFSALL